MQEIKMLKMWMHNMIAQNENEQNSNAKKLDASDACTILQILKMRMHKILMLKCECIIWMHKIRMLKMRLEKIYIINVNNQNLTLPMLRLLLSTAKGCKDFWKPSRPCHVGIHKLAFNDYSQMRTHIPICQGFNHFSGFLHHFSSN